jgi:hypothetical protein
MKLKAITFLILVTTLLFLATCNAPEKIGVYKLNTKRSNSTITLFTDSSFIERSISDSGSKKCRGRWQPVNETDSIIEMVTLSCGFDIYTLTPTRKLKIKHGELIETLK